MLVSDEVMADGPASLSLYCIFDGHGGDQCSAFAAARIEKMVQVRRQQHGQEDEGGKGDRGGRARTRTRRGRAGLMD